MNKSYHSIHHNDIDDTLLQNRFDRYNRSFQVVEASLGIYTAFWGFAAFSLIGLVYMIVALPETKGKSFANIQARLRRDVARDNASKLKTVEY